MFNPELLIYLDHHIEYPFGETIKGMWYFLRGSFILNEENAKGNWHGFEVSIEGPVQEADLFQQAKSFHESITAGDINIKHESDEVQEEKHAF